MISKWQFQEPQISQKLDVSSEKKQTLRPTVVSWLHLCVLCFALEKKLNKTVDEVMAEKMESAWLTT